MRRYLVDLLICAGAATFIGTATTDNKSKQFALIKALRAGRGRDVARDHLLERLPRRAGAAAAPPVGSEAPFVAPGPRRRRDARRPRDPPGL